MLTSNLQQFICVALLGPLISTRILGGEAVVLNTNSGWSTSRSPRRNWRRCVGVSLGVVRWEVPTGLRGLPSNWGSHRRFGQGEGGRLNGTGDK